MKTKQKFLLTLATSAMAVCMSAGAATLAMAEETTATVEPKTLEQISFDMIAGASVRVKVAPTGIRFSATMSESDYLGLLETYENVSFGTVIMPAQYQTTKGELSVANLFGADAVYTWDGKETATEEAAEGETETKKLWNILQMESEIYEDTELTAENGYTTMRVNGSIASVKEQNLDLDFVGVCYIKADDEYLLATLNDNERNIVQVAQRAMDVETAYASTLNGIVDSYKTYYASKNDGATPKASYTVKTYLNDVEYSTTTETCELNETPVLNAPTETTIDGYTYVASRSVLSGRATIDNDLVLEYRYHKKADGVLYDFYDKEEAENFYYFESYGKYEQIDDLDAVKFDRSSNAWGTLKFTDTEIDDLFNVEETAYMYVYAYVKTPVTDTIGEIRFTYHYYNGTDWSSNTYETIEANQWNWLAIPIKTSSPNLAGIQFSFQRQPSGGSWQAIGETANEALYIKEIGFKMHSASVDFTRGMEDCDALMNVFKSSNATLLPNYDENFTYKTASASLRIVSQERYPKLYFTQSFVDWFNENGKTIKFYVCYDATSTNKFVKLQHTDSSQSSTNYRNAVYKTISAEKTWYTPNTTLTKTSLTNSALTTSDGLQFNKNAASHVNIYVHWVITYNA